MKLIRLKAEVIATFKDDNGIYKIGLGTDSLTKTEKELTAIAQQKYNEIKYNEANPPAPTVQELRQKEYLAQGITEKEMIVALWEDIIEKRPETRIALQTKREAVKVKYPINKLQKITE